MYLKKKKLSSLLFMSVVKIRLARGGAKKRPHYSIVVANATAPRDGNFIEKTNPLFTNSTQKVLL